MRPLHAQGTPAPSRCPGLRGRSPGRGPAAVSRAGATARAAATAAAGAASASHAAGQQQMDEASGQPAMVPAELLGRRQTDGAPVVRLVPIEETVAGPTPYAPIMEDAELLKDVHVIPTSRPAAAAPPVDVPGHRVVTDPAALDLIGEGLPIIRGPEFPDAYWAALNELSVGRAVPLPRPHPKFSLEDMARISREGPSFPDLVLEHAEALRPEQPEPMQPAAARAYNYVPAGVTGDWAYEIEPNWAQMQQMPLLEFYQGLRERNWTDRLRFNAHAAPWRLQFFRCGYHADPTGWKGYRAVVTIPATSSEQQGQQQQQQQQQQQDQQAQGQQQQCWVAMPDAGPPAALEEQGTTLPSDVGFNAVFVQLYQAYEQALPREAKAHLARHGFVPPGRFKYYCPGERLLDVSYHWAPGHERHGLVEWLLNPQLSTAVQWANRAADNCGIHELKEMRDQLWFLAAPNLPRPEIYIDPSNAGPLYFLICLTLGIVVPAMRRSRILDIKTLEEDMGAAMEFARSKSEARKEGLTGVEFRDVAGLGPILGEVVEVVEFLKDPKTFSNLGARPPKGILFEGDPGTGKTLMAKALAGEAMVPFYQMSGTEFTEGIVGLGAARVRDLFKRARANAPCVIFVDELDALGLKRAEGDGSGAKANEEREQTLNQLLTEMDGFTPDTGVVFLGATNRADLLDPALMRPGRFDRKIRMPKPDTEGRYEILKLHLRKKKVGSDVDLMQLARDLPGLVGADLANIVNEAQLSAVRDGREMLTARDMYSGVDRFTQGEIRPALPTKYKLPVTAYAAREVGTSIVASLLRREHGRIEPVERLSIQPRGSSLSRTLFARGTDEDYQVMTRGKLLDRIKVELAGGIAVRVVVGEETNFGLPDVKNATYLANKLVLYYGFSDLGITNFARQPYSNDFAIGSNRPRKVVSTEAMDELADWPTKNEDFRFDPLDPSDLTWHRYTDEVRKILKSCYEEVWVLLDERKDALWAGIKALSERKEMLGEELTEVLAQHPPVPSPPGQKPGLDDMVIFTKGVDDFWPADSIPWLQDAYPIPHFVKQMQQEQKEREKAAPTAGAGAKK